MELISTNKPMPKGDTRGRPEKYNLGKLARGQGLKVSVPDKENMERLRGSLYSSAYYHGFKIKTQYSNGVFTVWRV